jgi:hypothetical protein
VFALSKICFSIPAQLSVALITLHTCSAVGASQTAADANQFPVLLKAEAFLDHPITVTVTFKIFLPKDKKRYVPVSPTLAEVLSSPPIVYAKPELRVSVIRTECVPEDVIAAVGGEVVGGKGGHINCKIEIAPVRPVKKGDYDVILAFETVDTTFNMLNSTETFPKAVAHIQVEIWPSVAAKQEALRAAEAERRLKEEMAAQARREQQEAEARARKQKEEADTQARLQREEAEAQARHDARIALMKTASPFLGMGLLLAIAVGLQRKWFWPDFKAYIPAGTKMQFDSALPARSGLETGTILHTAWANARHGTRSRIKLETFVADNLSGRTLGKLDLLISVGMSVRPGVYLAILPGGAVRVHVSKNASQ